MAASLLDTNVLVHASFQESRFHDRAAQIVERGLQEVNRHCIAPHVLVEFAAVTTRKRFVTVPLAPSQVTSICRRLYKSRRLFKIYPKRATVMRAIEEGASIGIEGPRWYDMFLAATMRDAGIEVIITDNVDDFRNIPYVTPVHIQDAV